MISRGMEIASKGMMSLLDMNDTVANNLANVNTAGFKKSNLTFRSIYDTRVEQATSNDIKTADYRHVGDISMGSQTDRSILAFTQGILEKTDTPLDVAIEGDGFFKVKDDKGDIYYTRNGQLRINSKNILTTSDGDQVLDTKGKPIIIDLNATRATLNDIVIREKGELSINSPTAPQMLQTIGIYDFSNKADIESVGNSKFKVTNSEQNPELKADKFVLQQGMRELSNSSVITEMLNSINVSRNYESLSKFIKESGTLMDTAINIGRVR